MASGWATPPGHSQVAHAEDSRPPAQLAVVAAKNRLGLKVVAVNGNKILVKWKKVAKAKAYRVEVSRKKGIKPRVFKRETKIRSMWVAATKVKENKTYFIKVTATRSKGKPISAKVKAKTKYLTPAIPRNLKVRPASPNAIALSWTAADLATGYEIRLSKTPYGAPAWTTRVKENEVPALAVDPAAIGVGPLFFVRVAATRGTAVSAPSAVKATALPFPRAGPPVFTAYIGSYNILTRNAKDGQGRSLFERIDLLAERMKPWHIAGVQEATYALFQGERPILVLADAAGLEVSRLPSTGAVCARHSTHVLYQASKYTLVDCGEDLVSDTATIDRYAAWSVLHHTASGRELFVVSAHLTDGMGASRNVARRAEVAKIREMIALHSGSRPVIVMGDLNEAPIDYASTVSTDLASWGYAPVDLVAEQTSKISSPSYHGFIKPTYVDARIDHIAISSELYAKYFAVRVEGEAQAPSDHYPIVAKIEVP